MCQIRTAVSTNPNTQTAVAQVLSEIAPSAADICILFCSARRSMSELQLCIPNPGKLPGLIGCTSAGEMTPLGYLNNSITGVALSSKHFKWAITRIDNVGELTLASVTRAVDSLKHQLKTKVSEIDPRRCFAVLLTDGTVNCEDKLAAALGAELSGIPLVGGSAGDDWTDRPNPVELRSYVLHDGIFRANSAVIMLLQTNLRWSTFTHNHYSPSGHKAVITAAIPEERLVLEMNGDLAISVYKELGGTAGPPSPGFTFAADPLMIQIGGQWYPRGILRLNENGSIRFACAIERGLVVTMGQPSGMVEKLAAALDRIKAQIGPPALILAFDCASRMMNMDINRQRQQVSDLIRRNNVIGIASLGEQFNSVHLNNSFTGLAIGQF